MGDGRGLSWHGPHKLFCGAGGSGSGSSGTHATRAPAHGARAANSKTGPALSIQVCARPPICLDGCALSISFIPPVPLDLVVAHHARTERDARCSS